MRGFFKLRKASGCPLCGSNFEAANFAAESALCVLPNPFDHPRVVVAVRKIVIQGREAVFLAGFFHVGQLIVIQRELIDVAPIERGRIHREAWGTVLSVRMITLFCPARQFDSRKPSSPSSP